MNSNLDEAHSDLARIYSHVGLLEEAVHESDQALVINPSGFMAQITRGQALLFQAKYDLALGFLQSLSEETYPPLWFYQTALALFNLGRKEEAIVKIEDFLRKYPEDPGGTAASVRAMLFAAAGEEAKVPQERAQLADAERGVHPRN